MALTDNLVAYWTWDESSGNASDSTANNNDLTNNNTVGYSPALIGNGSDFSIASSRYFSIASGSQTGLAISGGAITMNVWHKGNSNLTDVVGNIFRRMGGINGYGYDLMTSGTENTPNNAYRYALNGTGGVSVAAFGTEGMATDGVRRMVTLTYSDITVKGYINGSLVYTSGTVINRLDSANANTFYVGTFNGSVEFLDGQLDEGGIWSRALSDAEITTLYNGGAGLTYPFILPTFTATPMMHHMAISGGLM